MKRTYRTKPFILQSECDGVSFFLDRSEHDSYEEAVEAAGVRFDNGDAGDFRIFEIATDTKTVLRGYTFLKVNCPRCQKEVRSRDTILTRDCHGIPYRSVCPRCFDEIMDENGYDGEPYTEADENIYWDY